MALLIKKKYEHIVSVNTRINIEKEETYNTHIVYYINCMVNANYLDWLTNQMDIVKNFDSSVIYIVATIEQDKEHAFRETVLQMFPNVNIDCHYENEFEYRGILKVWELGRVHNSKNDIILYFHSKGVTHHPRYEYNKYDEYNVILKDFDKIKEIFTIFPDIDKIGFHSGGIGWIWFNFWFARGSYIFQVEKPIKTESRHYYEDWLGRKVKPGDEYCDIERDNVTYYENTLRNCYGFSSDNPTISNIGHAYCPGIGMHKI
jgi:hypothetical protein